MVRIVVRQIPIPSSLDICNHLESLNTCFLVRTRLCTYDPLGSDDTDPPGGGCSTLLYVLGPIFREATVLAFGVDPLISQFFEKKIPKPY